MYRNIKENWRTTYIKQVCDTCVKHMEFLIVHCVKHERERVLSRWNSPRPLSDPGPLQSLLHSSFCKWPTLNTFSVGKCRQYLKAVFPVCSNVPMEWSDCLGTLNLEKEMIGFYVHPVIIFTPADTQLDHRWGHFGFTSLSRVAKCRQLCHTCLWLLLLYRNTFWCFFFVGLFVLKTNSKHVVLLLNFIALHKNVVFGRLYFIVIISSHLQLCTVKNICP